MPGASARTLVAPRPREFKALRKNQLGKAARLVEEGMRKAIATGKGPGGDFAPYAPATIRRKLRQGQPVDRVTLNDTGALLASIGRGIEGRIAVVKTGAPHAKFVNEKRQFNGMGDKTLAQVREYITTAWRGKRALGRVSPRGPFSGSSTRQPFGGSSKGPFG